MTWTPRIIPGGATPRRAPPLEWWHIDHGYAEAVMVQWPTTTRWEGTEIRIAAYARASFIITDAGPQFLAGHRPDETTIRELAEDYERWRAEHEADPHHTLESPRWGARYRR